MRTLCHTSSEGHITYFDPNQQCKVEEYLSEDRPLSARKEIAVSQEGNVITVSSLDGKAHTLSVLETDSSHVLQNIRFENSYSWPSAPEAKGNKILIVVDGIASLYIL